MALRNFLSIVLYCYHYYYYYYYCIIIIVITIITGPYQAQSLFNVTVSWGFGGGGTLAASFIHDAGLLGEFGVCSLENVRIIGSLKYPE